MRSNILLLNSEVNISSGFPLYILILSGSFLIAGLLYVQNEWLRIKKGKKINKKWDYFSGLFTFIFAIVAFSVLSVFCFYIFGFGSESTPELNKYIFIFCSSPQALAVLLLIIASILHLRLDH